MFVLHTQINFVNLIFLLSTTFFAAYIQEIYETILSSSKKDLKEAAVKLKEMCPPPMNTMLSKQTKSDALKKRSDRRQIIIKDVPPSTPGTRSLYVTFFCYFPLNRTFASVWVIPDKIHGGCLKESLKPLWDVSCPDRGRVVFSISSVGGYMHISQTT